MDDVTFVDRITPINASWLNGVNDLVFSLVGNGTYNSNYKTVVTTNNIGISPAGSIGQAGPYSYVERTGGYGVYGNMHSNLYVSGSVPNGEFDVAMTGWVTSSNFTATGAANFGGWFAANTPSSTLGGQTYTGGASIGVEINVGNRWADFGLQNDIGGTKYTVGLQVVPDIAPAQDGSTSTTFPGSFGIVKAPSVHGHKWWVGELLRNDTIMPAGHAYLLHGGSTSPNKPLDIVFADGHWTTGIDLASCTFSSTTALLLAAGHAINIGGGILSGGGTGAIALSANTGNAGTLYSNNFGAANFSWDYSGSARIGFYGSSPVAKATGYGTPTNVSKTANLAGTSATLSEVGGTLAALIADLKALGLIGA